VAPKDQEIIKVCAQYVSVNGPSLLDELMEKMGRSEKFISGQFDFLKPAHPLFGYFSSLVEQYSKILDEEESEEDEPADQEEKKDD